MTVTDGRQDGRTVTMAIGEKQPENKQEKPIANNLTDG